MLVEERMQTRALPLRIGERLVGLDLARPAPCPCCRRSRARAVEKPYQQAARLAQVRRDARSSIADFTGWNKPSCSARHRRPASTVISTSAGLRAPSLRMRSISGSSPPSMRLILMPVSLGEVVVERLVGLVVARRVEVQDLVLGRWPVRATSRAGTSEEQVFFISVMIMTLINVCNMASAPERRVGAFIVSAHSMKTASHAGSRLWPRSSPARRRSK